MGLEHFQQVCAAVSSVRDAQVWCVAQEGTCCGVCANTLASLGTRIGLTFTVFFATLVTVVDGAEAPFIFMTTCLQAVAYLVTVLQAGLMGDGISRFHAYYALVCSMGFLCPLSAASVTATHYLYGGAHQTGSRLLPFRTDVRRAHVKAPSMRIHSSRRDGRSLGSPFSSGLTPLTTGSTPAYHEGTSTGIPPGPLLDENDTVSCVRWPGEGPKGEDEQQPLVPRDEEAAIEWPAACAIPARAPRFSAPSTQSPASDFQQLPPCPMHSRTIGAQDITIASVPLFEASATAGSQTLRQRPRRLQKPRPPDWGPRVARPTSGLTTYTPEQSRKIEEKVKDGAWRRYGMIAANATLFVLWLVVFLFLHGIAGSFKFIQTNCQDPKATELLTVAAIALLCVSVIIFGVCVLNFYAQILHRHLRRILDYSRHPNVWTQLAVPAIFSGAMFVLWVALLWTSYELAAQPSSSLLSESEQSTTFASVLSIALVIKPVCDLIKALTKHYKRRARLNKAQQKKRMSARPATPPPSRSSPYASRAHSTRDECESGNLEKGAGLGGCETPLLRDARASRLPSERWPDQATPPPTSSRLTPSTSGEFSRGSSQADECDMPRTASSAEDCESAEEDEARRFRARRKRISLRRQHL